MDGGGGQSPAPSSSIGLRANVGVAGGSLLLVVVAVQLVLHQQDEDEDEDGCHDDAADNDDHGPPQELWEEEPRQRRRARRPQGRSLSHLVADGVAAPVLGVGAEGDAADQAGARQRRHAVVVER